MENFDDQWWFNVYDTAATKVTGKKAKKSHVPTDEVKAIVFCAEQHSCSWNLLETHRSSSKHVAAGDCAAKVGHILLPGSTQQKAS
jgi:hypothetical protein